MIIIPKVIFLFYRNHIANFEDDKKIERSSEILIKRLFKVLTAYTYVRVFVNICMCFLFLLALKNITLRVIRVPIIQDILNKCIQLYQPTHS